MSVICVIHYSWVCLFILFCFINNSFVNQFIHYSFISDFKQQNSQMKINSHPLTLILAGQDGYGSDGKETVKNCNQVSKFDLKTWELAWILEFF